MRIHVGVVAALFRYPVKSMGGERLEVADLGWYGVDGDRRLAFRRLGERGGFPWLTASRVPELILYAPLRRGQSAEGDLPTHVRTPEGAELEVFGAELAADVGRRLGAPVEMMHLNRGIFDEASLSIITSATVGESAKFSAQRADVRRFRPNIVLESAGAAPFGEDAWVGGVLWFGDRDEVSIAVTNRDERCAMVNFDPDTARVDAELLKTIVRERGNRLGVYAAVTRRGRIAVGQPVYFEPASESSERR